MPEGYPDGMLKNYNDLYNAMCGQSEDEYNMDQRYKRLIIFVPEDAYPWTDMNNEIDYTTFVPISATRGGIEIGKDAIIATIQGSIA